MTITTHEPQSREEVQKEFDRLLRKHEAQASQISTKAEEAERNKHRELVERAAQYTVASIVNDLARLQLGFGTAVEDIATKLDAESGKLGELRRAIEIERGRMEQLRGTLVAAEALAILEQDHRHQLAALEEQAEQARAELSEQMSLTREQWQRQAQADEQEAAEHAALQAKERQLAAEQHAYEQARLDRLEADDQAQRRRELERQLADLEATKDKDWSARERVLADGAARTDELRTRVQGFEAELEQAKKDARDKAIAAVHRESKHELEMLDKEHVGNVKVYELKVQTLEDRITRQAALITDLDTKLDATIAKSQGLAEQAFRRPSA